MSTATAPAAGLNVISPFASGLQAGERVVVDGQSRLFPGAKISERAGKPAAPPPGETAEGGRRQGSAAQGSAVEETAGTRTQTTGGAT